MVTVIRRDDAIDDGGGDGRPREDWIAALPGFWTAIWQAQEVFGIQHIRFDNVPAPLPPTAATLRSRRLARIREDAARDRNAMRREIRNNILRLPSPRDTRAAKNAFLDCLIDWAATIAIELGLMQSDVQFVAGCVHGGIEAYLFGMPTVRCEPLVRVAAIARRRIEQAGDATTRLAHYEWQFEPNRVYLDVTDVPAARIATEVESVVQTVVDVRETLEIPEPRVSPEAGRPSNRAIAAYAQALKSEGWTWKRVAQEVNDRGVNLGLTTVYGESTIARLVRDNRPL